MWAVWKEGKYQPIRNGPKEFFKNFIISKGGRIINDTLGKVDNEYFMLYVLDDIAIIFSVKVEKIMTKKK